MAFDSYYQWNSAGSNTASAATAHSIFDAATSGGLSVLNADAVLHIHIQASGANMRLLKTEQGSVAGDGIWFQQDTDTYTPLPPMTRTAISQLHFRNDTAADNAVVRWVMWYRAG